MKTNSMEEKLKFKLPFIAGPDLKNIRRMKMYNHYKHLLLKQNEVLIQLQHPDEYSGRMYDRLVSTYRNLLIEFDNLENDICREFFALNAGLAMKNFELKLNKKENKKRKKKKSSKTKRQTRMSVPT